MSQHRMDTTNNAGIPFVVVAGFDPQLDEIFFSIRVDQHRIPSSSLRDEDGSGDTQVGVDFPSFNSQFSGMRPTLNDLPVLAAKYRLTLPDGLLREIALDIESTTGNRVVFWEGGTIASDVKLASSQP